MKTMSIRELRGAALKSLTDAEGFVGITSDRVLVAIFVPVTEDWVKHVLELNKTRVQQNILEGELEIRAGQVVPLEQAVAMEPGEAHERGHRMALPFGNFGIANATFDFLTAGMGSLLSRFGVSNEAEATTFTTRQIRVGSLSGKEITAAAAERQILAVTNDRILVGVVLPVSDQVVAHLVDENLSRIYQSIDRGEAEIQRGGFVTLDQAVEQEVSESAPSASIRHALGR